MLFLLILNLGFELCNEANYCQLHVELFNCTLKGNYIIYWWKGNKYKKGIYRINLNYLVFKQLSFIWEFIYLFIYLCANSELLFFSICLLDKKTQ